MNESEIKLQKLFSRILGVPEGVINDQTSMQTLVNWDSLKHMELMVALEEEFKTSRFAITEIISMTSIPAVKKVLGDKGVNF